MLFCKNCFKDKEIANIISSSSYKTIGDCPVCKSVETILYNSEKQEGLKPYFADLLSMYSPSSFLPKSYPIKEQYTLAEELGSKRWDLFVDRITNEQINEIVRSICSEDYTVPSSLFKEKVGFSDISTEDYLKDIYLVKDNDWNQFVNDIKTKNRYHTKHINLDILREYCGLMVKTYKTGTVFYRARISERDGYPISQMSAPPVGKSSAGRANAGGITCLYLADEEKTALHEVRAAQFDFVSIAEFRARRNITIVNLRDIAKISPFAENVNLVSYAINKRLLAKLDSEISKALRRSDSYLDYVPTQYIVDYIRSIEDENGYQLYDGIEYNSTTAPGGFNLAIFEPDLFEGISVSVHDICEIDYKYSKVM